MRRTVIANYLEIVPPYRNGAFTTVGDRLQYIRWMNGREALFANDGRQRPLTADPQWLPRARDAFDALGYLQR